jgi:hypothetical protein
VIGAAEENESAFGAKAADALPASGETKARIFHHPS